MGEVNASFWLNLNNYLSSCLLMSTIQISILTTRLIQATECELKRGWWCIVPRAGNGYPIHYTMPTYLMHRFSFRTFSITIVFKLIICSHPIKKKKKKVDDLLNANGGRRYFMYWAHETFVTLISEPQWDKGLMHPAHTRLLPMVDILLNRSSLACLQIESSKHPPRLIVKRVKNVHSE